MSAQEAGRELDALIAEIMEPKPAPISARALRATYRKWGTNILDTTSEGAA